MKKWEFRLLMTLSPAGVSKRHYVRADYFLGDGCVYPEGDKVVFAYELVSKDTGKYANWRLDGGGNLKLEFR